MSGRAWWVTGLLLMSSGCGRSCASDPVETGRRLVLGTTQEPSTLDPVFAVRAGEQEMVRLLYLDLVTFDDRAQVVPQLAAATPELVTETATVVVRWQLRDRVWSDGRPVTVADVERGRQIEANPSVEAINHELAREVAAIRGAGRRFEVRWKKARRGLAGPRAHVVLPAHAYPEPSGPGFRGFGREPTVSNGPFRLADWKPGQRMVFEPNPFWRGTAPGLERIVFRFFPSDDAFETELAAGGIDVLSPSSGLNLTLGSRLGAAFEATHELVTCPSGLLLQLGVRLDHPVVGRLAIRQRISAAVDRGRMADIVYGGRARPALGLYGPAHPAHRDQRPSRSPSPAPEGHAEALDEPLTLAFASGSEASERAAVYLAAVLEEVGLKTVPTALPLKVLFKKILDRTQAPLTLFAWRTRPDWAGQSLLQTAGRLNSAGFSDPEVDGWFSEAERAPQLEDWIARLHRIEDRAMEQLPLIPLLFRDEVSLRPRALRGWRPTGTTTPVTWNAEDWGWETAPQ